MKTTKSKKIVFVCTGNTCRSPMAEILLKAELKKRKWKGFSVGSAGIKAVKGDTINPKSLQALTEHGYEVKTFSSTPLTPRMLKDSFAIVCMTEAQRDFLMDMRWNVLRKAGVEDIENNVYSFAEITGYDVLDPYGRDMECYRYVFGLIAAGIPILIEKLGLGSYAQLPAPRKPRTAKPKTEIIGSGEPKKRGRPKKEGTSTVDVTTSKRGRGRPKKTVEQISIDSLYD